MVPSGMPSPAAKRTSLCVLSLLAAAWSMLSAAEEALIAVAANFVPAAIELAQDFETQTDHRLELAAGSTGKLYAQIVHGAPFDILLAADQARPIRLEEEHLAVHGTRFTYASGQLALWVPGAVHPAEIMMDEGKARILLDNAKRLAIANPELAPYGSAAVEVLRHLSGEAIPADRIVKGENVAQAYAMVASGAADAGLVALSHLRARGDDGWWPVPAHWHGSIDQDAVLLIHGKSNPAAKAFLDYLKSDDARVRIVELGFTTEP